MYPLSRVTLTRDALSLHDKTFDNLLHTCQTVAKAITTQKAGRELRFDLPMEKYLPDRLQVHEWV